jgi:selenocysteine-specific elongation factor
LNLQGIEISDVARGDALVERDWFRPTLMLDCDLEVLSSSPIPVKDLTRVHLHLGTAQVLARARVLGGVKAISPGERGLAQLRLEAPIVAARGDRFILRRYSPLETIAGGVVLDAYPEKHCVASLSVASAGARAARVPTPSRLASSTRAGLRESRRTISGGGSEWDRPSSRRSWPRFSPTVARLWFPGTRES